MGGVPRTVAATGRIVRFDAVQRAAHWANALVFFVLVATAVPLYFPAAERVVGRHVLVAQVHVWAGICWIVPIAVSMAGPWGARMRRDMHRVNRWTAGELRWLVSGGRAEVELDKFNPGQKLHTAFIGATVVVMLFTGVVMKWFGLFPVGWRTGATFVHEVLAFLVVAAVTGHVVVALLHPSAMRSMVEGSVSADWARRHAAAWAREVRAGETTRAPDALSPPSPAARAPTTTPSP